MQRVVRVILIGVTVLLAACSIRPDTVVMSDVDVNDWHKTTTLTYENSAIERCDMNITLHVNRHFSAKEVALQVTMLTPDSLRYTEQVTLPVELAKPMHPSRAATDIELPYRRDIHLKHKGEYTWQITPTEAIDGVEAAGINFYIKD